MQDTRTSLTSRMEAPPALSCADIGKCAEHMEHWLERALEEQAIPEMEEHVCELETIQVNLQEAGTEAPKQQAGAQLRLSRT